MRIIYCTIISIFILSFNAFAEKHVSIEAIVNDEIVTNLELEHRADIVMTINKMDKDSETYKAVKKHMLQVLIDEHLLSQQSKRHGIRVTADEIAERIKMMAKDMGYNISQFKDFIGRKKWKSLENQVRVQLIWAKIIAQHIEPSIDVSKHEIDSDLYNMVKRIQAKEINYKVKLAEIVLYLEPEAKNQKALAKLLRTLVSEIHKGADFQKLANDFSQSNTSKNGGVIGWLYSDQLSQSLRDKINILSIGQVSEPIIMEDRAVIIKMLDKQKLGDDNIKLDPQFIRNMLFHQKMERAVKKYLHNLRQEGYIEIRGS